MNSTWMLVIGVACVLALVFAFAQNQRQYPYVKAGPLLSQAEARFYFALLQALAPDQLLLTKIRVADLIKVKPGIGRGDKSSGFWKAFAQISQKHADFVVVNRTSFEACAVIELDDASHNNRRAKEGDTIKDKAFAAAGLPLLRVKAAGRYEPNELSMRLIAAIDAANDKGAPKGGGQAGAARARAAVSENRSGPSL